MSASPATAPKARKAAAALAKPPVGTKPGVGGKDVARSSRTGKKEVAVAAVPTVPDEFDGIPEKTFLASQKQLLIEERGIYLGQAQMLRAEADLLAVEMEPGDVQFDDESGEGGTMSVERERDLAMSAQASAAVEEIERALARIEQGVYGICEACRKPIPRARLSAIPFATLCVACKSGGLSRR